MARRSLAGPAVRHENHVSPEADRPPPGGPTRGHHQDPHCDPKVSGGEESKIVSDCLFARLHLLVSLLHSGGYAFRVRVRLCEAT